MAFKGGIKPEKKGWRKEDKKKKKRSGHEIAWGFLKKETEETNEGEKKKKPCTVGRETKTRGKLREGETQKGGKETKKNHRTRGKREEKDRGDWKQREKNNRGRGQ